MVAVLFGDMLFVPHGPEEAKKRVAQIPSAVQSADFTLVPSISNQPCWARVAAGSRASADLG